MAAHSFASCHIYANSYAALETNHLPRLASSLRNYRPSATHAPPQRKRVEGTRLTWVSLPAGQVSLGRDEEWDEAWEGARDDGMWMREVQRNELAEGETGIDGLL